MVGMAVGLTFTLAVVLWAKEGVAVFFEISRAGFAACFG
jgi:hypothetical protein